MTIAAHRATGELLDQVQKRCETDHYLHRWPDPRSLPFAYALYVPDRWAIRGAGDLETGYYAPDGRLYGLVVMKKPQHHQQRGLFGYKGLPTSWQVLDLARVWIHPRLQMDHYAKGVSPNSKLNEAGFKTYDLRPLNVFSQLVSKVLKHVQADWLDHHPPRFLNLPYHIEVIISYCDLAHHDGAAYRASGFTWNGYSSDHTKEVYFRKLRPPLKSWQPTRPAQLPLLPDFPLIHA